MDMDAFGGWVWDGVCRKKNGDYYRLSGLKPITV